MKRIPEYVVWQNVLKVAFKSRGYQGTKARLSVLKWKSHYPAYVIKELLSFFASPTFNIEWFRENIEQLSKWIGIYVWIRWNMAILYSRSGSKAMNPTKKLLEIQKSIEMSDDK